MAYDPWSARKIPTAIEKVMASFDARCIAADILPPKSDAAAETIVIGEWMPGPGTVDTSKPDGWSWRRDVTIWAPLDKAGRWYVNKHPVTSPWYARRSHIGRRLAFCVSIDAALASRHPTDAHRVMVWAGDDGRMIDAAIDLFGERVRQFHQEARDEAAWFSRQGFHAGFVDRPAPPPRSERLAALADILAGTPDAEEARRIADEWDGSSSAEGRFKKLKRMAQKHGVWREGVGL